MIGKTKEKEVLIAAVTPSFLEKGADWFSEHLEKITRARRGSTFWEHQTLFLEEGTMLSLSSFLRTLDELGYERTDFVSSPGEFSRQGGFLTVFPINTHYPYCIEFLGNRIERISPLEKLEAPAKKPKKGLRELELLRPGDYVVHLDHGVGVFRGFTQKLEAKTYEETWKKEGGAVPGEDWYIVVEYAPPREGQYPDRLLVPLSQGEKLSPYFGFETPTVHRLGSDLWQRTKRRVKAEVEKIAKELLELYAKREIAERPAYPGEPSLEKALERSFPYVETEDQLRALEEIYRDFSHEKPMDRVLIGDVGFGKTEVALRAAFRVVFSGRQAAVLTPTTILSWQHWKTFQERLRAFPVTVGLVSRLQKKRALKETLSKIASGEVDIIIGTHRLLSHDVKFKNLGFLIVDEEQRFGVRAKEHLKKMRPEVDVLSLSATPIPRTMYLSLSKIRGVSRIQTPPAGRLPIKTFVLPYSKKIIKSAIEEELKRRGQVFFLHNRIQTMEIRRHELHTLVPKARLEIIHSQLPEEKLISIMDEFRRRKIDVLVATTIIENGLDLSNVNTLIVAQSARLGLGEAYQLRGRIGRGERQAYAYFLYPPKALTETSKFRLQALKEARYLGAGYKIAMKDLELRGAGNILGKEQSGAINAVGLNLYLQILGEAIENLKAR